MYSDSSPSVLDNHIHHEEAFITMGESGELLSILSAAGDSLGSSAVFEDASEMLLATEVEGIQSGDDLGGIPEDIGQSGL